MRELSTTECHHISGASYEEWQVILLSGVSSGLAFGTIEIFTTLSLIEGLKLFAICSVPTAIASGLIIGSFELVEMAGEWNSDAMMSHC